MENLLPLQYASPDSAVQVCHVCGNSSVVHRLNELGLREGVTVQVVQSGTPCIVQLEGHRLAVRTEEGVMILVAPLELQVAAAQACLEVA